MKKILRLTTLAIALHFVFGVVTANATEQYQTEVSAFYSRTYFGQESDNWSSQLGMSGEVFFAPVNTEEHPYAEAAFLERIGSTIISAALEEDKAGAFESDGPTLSIGVNLAKPSSPFVVKLMYTWSRTEADYSPGFTDKSNDYDIKAGYYFTKTLLAGFEYSYGSSEVSFALFPSITTRSRDYGLFAKYVLELENFKELSFEATVSENTIGNTEIVRNTKESINVDYFFNKSLSIGVGFQNSSGTVESTEGQTYSANVRYFISPHFSVQAIYDRFRNSNPSVFFNESNHTYELILAGRF